jgi:hypothetical protein
VWIIIIVVVLALLGFFARGRRYAAHGDGPGPLRWPPAL